MLKGLPLPQADDDTKPFWEGCNQGRFLLSRCSECATYRWPPGPMCPVCQSENTEWIESSGHGKVYSWVVVHHPPHSVLREQVPYIVALIELEEGVRVVGNIVGCQSADVVTEMAVEMVFEEVSKGILLPNFRVVAAERYHEEEQSPAFAR